MLHHPLLLRRARCLTVAAAAIVMLAGCSGSGSTESQAPVPDTTAATVATTIAPTAAADASVAVSITLAPSGDDELDQLDAELMAFEEESQGLDSAAAAAEGQ